MRICAFAKTVPALALFSLSILLTPSFASETQKVLTQEQAPSHPTMLVQNPDYNFGTAVQGNAVEHAFTVKNTGKEVLKIERVKVS